MSDEKIETSGVVRVPEEPARYYFRWRVYWRNLVEDVKMVRTWGGFRVVLYRATIRPFWLAYWRFIWNEWQRHPYKGHVRP
jgi:hypothetical protein